MTVLWLLIASAIRNVIDKVGTWSRWLVASDYITVCYFIAEFRVFILKFA